MFTTMFKIRNKNTGEFFMPGKGWDDNGKYYRTLGHTRKAFKYIMEKFSMNRAELEVVEFEIREKNKN